MKEKKIAILTINDDDNYGNRLQNYATQNIITKLGYNVETIKNNKGIYNNSVGYFKYLIKSMIKTYIPMKSQYKRYKNFKKFNKNIIYSRYLIDEDHINDNISHEYDFFVTGSDQVWNPYFDRTSKIDFLDFVPLNKRISFSASFGVKDIPDNISDKYSEYLNKFKNISVREYDGKLIVEKLTNRNDVKVLVDPTILVKDEEWKVISKKPDNMYDDKYILNYFLGELSSERKELINSFAKERGFKVINILDPNDQFYTCGPAEFLYLEANAELICTDSFHSSIFGIIFKRPFIVFDREDSHKSMNSRIETLLDTFELKSQYYSDGKLEKYINCNFENSDLIIENKRLESINFLKNSFDSF